MEDFGGKLRQARERRGVSLRQISASTKISIGALEALERSDISKLPGGIFSRAFVRSYALEVGLDPEQTVRDFLARFGEAPLAPSMPSEVPAAVMTQDDTAFEARRQTAVRIARIAGAVGGVVVVAALLAILHRRSQARAASATLTPSSAVAPAPTVAAPPVSSEPPPQPAVTTQPPSVAPVAGTVLDLHPTADCWISASADGKKLFARVVSAGEHQTITFTRDAVVDVGDAGSFAYSINGREGKPLGETGQVRTLKLTPKTVSDHVR